MKRRPTSKPRARKAPTRASKAPARRRAASALERENESLRAKVAALEESAAAARAAEKARFQAVAESEAKFRRLHDSRIDGFAAVGMDGRIREFNTRFQEMLGYPADEVLALTYQELTPAKWHGPEARILEEQVLTRGYSDLYEKEYRRKDGTVFPVELRASLIRDDEGRPSGMWAAVRDITERKRIEEQLRESTRYIETVLEQAPIGFAVHTIDDGVGRFVSARYEEIYGVPRGTIDSHHTFFEKVWPNDPVLREEIKTRVVADMMSGDPSRMHWENVPIPVEGGGMRYVNAMNIPLLDQNLIVSTVWDVSARVRAEQALRESEAKFKTAFLTSVDPIYISTLAEGRFLEVNDAFVNLFGYSRAQLIGRPTRELGLWADYAQRDRVRDRLLSAGFVKDFEAVGRKKTGEIFTAELCVTTLRLHGEHCVLGVVRDISERKRAEHALAESEQRFRTLIEDSPVAIRLSRGGRALYANKQYLNLYGYRSVGELVGAPIEDGWAPESRVDLTDRASRNERGLDVPVDYEGIALRPDGTRFPAHAAAAAIQLPDGPALIAFVTDITERVKSQEALRRSEQRFRALIEDAPVAIRVNRGQHTLYANPRYLALHGYEHLEELLRVPVLELWAPECREEVHARVCRFAAGLQSTLEYEGVGLRRDGTRFPLHTSIGPVQLPDGAAVIVYATDITDRKAAESALRESEERFRQVAETVTDFIWEVDAEGLYTYTSPAVRQILGYEPGELVGRKHFYDLFADHEREELKRAAFDVFAAKEPFRRFPNTNVASNGRMVRLETSGSPMLDDAGNLLGYRGADSDVTAQWLNELAVRNLTGRLIRAQEAERSRLARELHDDFSQRIALAAIRLDLLRQSPPETVDELRATIDGLREHVQALGKDVRRMSHDLHPARLEQLGLVAAVRGLCTDLSAANRIAIRYETRDVPREVPDAVALCLYRVAQEALQNVLKHSGATNAVVELTASDRDVRLRVTDDGAGFEMDSTQLGDSLGLANMRERVRSIAGRLSIESVPGQGTWITVDAPLATDRAS